MNPTASQTETDSTKQAIMEAANQLFLKSGYHGVSMSSIAKEARVTKSLIHHHFGSKKQLWNDVVDRHFSSYERAQRRIIDQAQPGDGTRPIEDSMEIYFRFFLENPEVGRMLAWCELEENSGNLKESTRYITQAGIEKIEEGQASGAIRNDIPARFILSTFLSIVEGWFRFRSNVQRHATHSGDPHDEDEAFLKSAKALIQRALEPR